MNKHVEKAKELRNATPMVHNCAQTIMEVYANDLGINKELANHLVSIAIKEQDYAVLLRYFSFGLNRLKSYRVQFEQGEKRLVIAY